MVDSADFFLHIHFEYVKFFAEVVDGCMRDLTFLDHVGDPVTLLLVAALFLEQVIEVVDISSVLGDGVAGFVVVGET